VIDSLEQLAQSTTFTMLNGRLSRIDDAGANAANRVVLSPGSIVDSKYKIVGLIGQGGMGAIYKVHHLMLQKEMALKTFRSHGLSADSWQRFQREAQAIAKLDHKNIVDVFDFGMTEGGLPYYTMELLTGQSLSDTLHQSNRIAPAAALKIFRQVAAALAHAHRQNIVHRDIKPANIFLVTDGPGQSGQQLAKLVDFGIAKLAEGSVLSDELSITTAGTIFGSPLYMSPEQSLGVPTDPRTDMYSFGCTLYHALTGNPPFVGKTAFLTMMLHQTEKAPSLQDSGTEFRFPRRLEAVITKLLEKKPENRYENFDQVEEELRWCRRAIQTDQPTSVRANTFGHMPASDAVGEDNLETRQKGPFRNNRLPALIGISTACLITIAVVLTWGALHKTTSKLPSRQPSQTAPGQPPESEGPYLIESNSKERIFRFPAVSHLGFFTINGRKETINCQGLVRVPTEGKITFFPDRDALDHPELFRRFGPADLYGIQLDYENRWSDQHIEAISSLTGLHTLLINGIGQLRPETIMLLDKLVNVKYLSLSDANVSGRDLIKLKVLPKIEFLRVSTMADMPVLFRFLANNDAHIKALVANSCKIGAGDFLAITRIKSLIYFSGQTDMITNETINKVAVAPHWQGLNLMTNPIRDGAIDSLSRFKDLQFLNLQTDLLTQNGREQLKKKLPPNCKILNVGGNEFERECSPILAPLQ
jgi:serine/threonine protein kinase